MNASEKRKVDCFNQEYRFKGSMTENCDPTLLPDNIFTKQSAIQELAVKVSYMLSYNLTKLNKTFSGCEFLKDCRTVSGGG